MAMIAANEAIAFVRRHGNRLDQLRLRNALGEPCARAEAEEILARYQFADGSWDYQARDEATDHVGSLGGTIHSLRWVRELALDETGMMVHTIEFLRSIQSPGGSFYETDEKLAHSPQDWLQKDTLIDHFYFTAAVPMRLLSLGCREESVIEPAMQWLEQHWQDWQLVTATWYNLWALLCIAPAIDRLGTRQFERCYAAALAWLPDLDAQPLTWLLDALEGAGYSRDEPLVAEGIARLLYLQGENGLWAEGEDSAVETTVTALRILLNRGRTLIPNG